MTIASQYLTITIIINAVILLVLRFQPDSISGWGQAASEHQVSDTLLDSAAAEQVRHHRQPQRDSLWSTTSPLLTCQWRVEER